MVQSTKARSTTATTTTRTRKPRTSPYLQCPLESCSVEFFSLGELVFHVEAAHEDFLGKLARRRRPKSAATVDPNQPIVGSPDPRVISNTREAIRSDTLLELETLIGHAVSHVDQTKNRLHAPPGLRVGDVLTQLNEVRERLIKINREIMALGNRATVIKVPRRAPINTAANAAIRQQNNQNAQSAFFGMIRGDTPSHRHVDPSELPEGMTITPA